MSSSEEYLDSLLDSILSGGKSEEEENPSGAGAQDALAGNRATEGGKAMSPDEIEEMLVSMGSLGGGEAEMDGNEADEGSTAGGSGDDFNIDELSLDGLDLGEDGQDEGGAGSTAGDGADDFNIDELSLDGLDLGESGQEDGGAGSTAGDGADDFNIDELSLDGLDLGEGGQEDGSADELASDADGMDDFALEETGGGGDDFNIDELSLDGLDLGEDGSADMSGADELASDAGEMNDFALEETDEGEDDMSSDEGGADDADGLMSMDEIDRLLEGDLSADGDEGASDVASGETDGADDFALEETDGGTDDFALEETGESEGGDDLSALLAGMEHDEDLSEINDLLEASDQGITADDDILAMLEGADSDGGSFDLFESDEAAREAEGIRELSPEEAAEREGGDQGKKKEKKKRKKLFGKKKKGGEDEAAEGADGELEALLGEVSGSEEAQEEKKPGLFARLLNFLLESDEDDEDPLAAEILADNAGETGTVTDENKELLQELSDEDKKGKKKKKKKEKKGKKGKEGEEEGGKPKKEKKKKEKKEKKKKEEEVDLFAPPEKKLSKKKVITVFLFCGTIAACIILLTTTFPDTMQRKEAQTAYNQGDYAEVYNLLYGKELNEQEEAIFQGSSLVLQMNRRLSSYNNYIILDMRLEALDALINGVVRYQKVLPEAENYNVGAEVSDIYGQIVDRLFAEFGVTEEEALEIFASEDSLTYTQRLEAIINGESFDEEAEEEGGVRDMLPEEEEILERIEGAE